MELKLLDGMWMNQVEDFRDSMLACQGLPSIASSFGIQNDDVVQLLNLSGSLK